MSEARATAHRLTWVLFGAQALASAGFIAGATIASIVGADLSGRESWAGLPSAAYLLGTALAAYVWGLFMERFGRRAGLGTGLGAGVLGAASAAYGVATASFPLLLAGVALVGAANAAVQQGRFAAAEIFPARQRGRAVAHVVMGGTVGAVLGPLMVGPLSSLARRLGLAELAGPYLGSLAVLALASLVIFTLLRPEPSVLARHIARLEGEPAADARFTGSPASILRRPPVAVAMATMVVSQTVMVMLMVITALHMIHHQHSLAGVSAVISSHTLGMYAFSLLSGRLTDRWGRFPVMLTGALALIGASALASLSPDLLPLAVALFVLGLGWNFCFVGGSSLLSDHLSASERARIQGLNDLMIGLAGTAGSLLSGLVFAALGYGAMCFVGGAAALGLVAVMLWWRLRRGGRPYPALS